MPRQFEFAHNLHHCATAAMVSHAEMEKRAQHLKAQIGETEASLPAHERTYRALRDMILFGALTPGEPVTIQGLTDRLRTGMTPVREALRRLTAEGALMAQGNRRIMVPVLDLPALGELTDARLALETNLAARAAQMVDRPDLAALSRIDTGLDLAMERGDIPAYLRENYRFHTSLYVLADAPILSALTQSLWLRFGPSLRIVCGKAGTSGLPDRHKDLLVALEQKDPTAATRAVEDDIRQGMDLIADNLV